MALTVRYCDPDHTGGTDSGTLTNPWESLSSMASGYAAGDHVYVKQTSSRHDAGSVTDFSTAAGGTTPVVIEGYKTTIGDGGDSGFDNAFKMSSGIKVGEGVCVKHFDIEGSDASNRLVDTSSVNIHWLLYHCRIKNTNTSSSDWTVIALDDEQSMFCCEVILPATTATLGGIYLADSCLAYGCKVEMGAASAWGFSIKSNASQYHYVLNNIVQGAGAGDGIRAHTFTTTSNKRVVIYGNSIYNVNDGISFDGLPEYFGGGNTLIMGNVIWDCAAYGITETGTSSAGAHLFYNAIGDCTTANFNGFDDHPVDDTDMGYVALTANPWVDPANGDFRLNNTSGGGAAIKEGLMPYIGNIDDTLNKAHYGAVQSLGVTVTNDFVPYNSGVEKFANQTIDLIDDTFACVLLNGYTPDVTHAQWSDISASEASGYTQVALGGKSYSETAGVGMWDANNVVFSSTSTTADFMAIVKGTAGSLNTTDVLVGYVALQDGGGAITVGGGDLTVSWTSSGIWRHSQ